MDTSNDKIIGDCPVCGTHTEYTVSGGQGGQLTSEEAYDGCLAMLPVEPIMVQPWEW